MATGKIKTLYSDKEKTEPLFPRTKTKAISDEEGTGLNTLLDNIVIELNNKAPAGYGLGTSATWIDDLNSATECGWYAFTADDLNRPFDYGVAMTINRYGGRKVQIAFNPHMAGCGEICIRSHGETEWLPWEYVNPPLYSGVEYRTTERYDGSPVYIRRVVYGYIEAGEHSIAHNIENINEIVGLEMINMGYGNFTSYFNCSADRTNISFTTPWTMGGFIYIIKYTKL